MNNAPSGDRRGFLALLLAGAACAVPAVTGLLGFLNPWRSQGTQGSQSNESSGRFIRVAALDDLKVDGPPQKLPVVSERLDAWTHSVEPVGFVFLRRVSEDKVEALQVKCPHEGCAVRFDSEKGFFACTCHSALFNPDGTRIDPKTSQSPRDLDTLEVRIDENTKQILVDYKDFRTGTAEKTAKT